MKKIFRSYLMLFSIAAVIIILDQITKTMVRENLALWSGVWAPWDWMLPYARIINIPNNGVAFGMFQNRGLIFTILSSLVSVLIIIYYPRVPRSDWSLRIAMGLQLGGAVGNLIDRITIGHVTDFISVGNFAVFNIADASITIGVVVLVIGVWLQERAEKQMKLKSKLAENQPVSEDDSSLKNQGEAKI